MKKKLKCFLQVSPQSCFASAALLVLRVSVGAAFIMHGWVKMQNPFAWISSQAPIDVPSFIQFLAALSEFGGGIALILGLLTSLSAFGIFCTMAVAVYLQAGIMKYPLVDSTGGSSSFELPLTYLVIMLLILILGPGKYSLDKIIFGERV